MWKFEHHLGSQHPERAVALQMAKLFPASCPPNSEREVVVSVRALSSLAFYFSVTVLIVRTSGQQLPVSASDGEHMTNWCLGQEMGCRSEDGGRLVQALRKAWGTLSSLPPFFLSPLVQSQQQAMVKVLRTAHGETWRLRQLLQEALWREGCQKHEQPMSVPELNGWPLTFCCANSDDNSNSKSNKATRLPGHQH
jgi:hypothetical protein